MNPDIQALLRYGDKTPSPTFWCKKCSVPLIQEKCERCGKTGVIFSKSPLRPVFKEELDTIRKQFRSKSKWLRLPDLSFWAAKRNYFYHGQKVYSIGLRDGNLHGIKFYQGRDLPLPKKSLKPETIITRLKTANRSSLNKLEYQAIIFIEQAVKIFHGRLPIVSFSGGKDSCVVSYLAKLALGSKIIHIFGDTTIEYPDTYKFIEEFKKKNPTLPFLVARPTKDFFELAENIGPPNRILRWCCTTHKTGPIGNLMASINGDGVLTFDGIRRAESVRRNKYNAVSFDSKIASQVLVHPIFFWNDTEIWLYIISRNIDVNEAYKNGFIRVGCLFCPFNSGWSEYLASLKYKDLIKRWHDFLINFAERICHKDKTFFVAKGWKTQVAGRHLGNYKNVLRAECDTQVETYNYTLSKSWDEKFWNYLKPLGKLSKIQEDGVIANYSLNHYKTNDPIMMLRVSRPRGHLRVTVLTKKNKRLLLQRFEKQVARFQACVMCKQCHNTCKFNAFSSNEFFIDENKCINCLDCVKKPCIAIDALRKEA